MHMKAITSICLGCFAFLFHYELCAQERVIDEVAAVVGKQIILQSDVESQYMQYISMGNKPDAEVKCTILEQMLLTKLMINQAAIDSVTVSDNQVEGELDRRIKYLAAQIGSEQKLEEYYKKTITEIKEDFRGIIEDQLLAQTMQSKITKDISASPSDVKEYMASVNPDSVPYVNSELEIEQIVKYPEITEEQKKEVKAELEALKKKIEEGSDFAVLAGLYSKDPGSARKGGELGFMNRGDLVPEFAAVAFSLKGKEVSKVFETQYGFHIVQLIERRGSQVNVRHILLKPNVTNDKLLAASQFLENLRNDILNHELTFGDAALKYSEDVDTKNNGGLIVNMSSGSTRFEPDQLDPAVFFAIDKLAEGGITSPIAFQAPDGRQAYRILRLRQRTKPHKANLKDDYQRIQNAATNEKQNKAMNEWVEKKRKTTFIRIGQNFTQCSELNAWTSK